MRFSGTANLNEMSHNDNADCWDSKENKVCFIFTFDEPPKGRKAWNRAIVNFVLITLFHYSTEDLEKGMKKYYNGYLTVI